MANHWNNKETPGLKIFKVMEKLNVAPENLSYRYKGLDSQEFTWEFHGTSITEKVAFLYVIKHYASLGLRKYPLDDTYHMIQDLEYVYG